MFRNLFKVKLQPIEMEEETQALGPFLPKNERKKRKKKEEKYMEEGTTD